MNQTNKVRSYCVRFEGGLFDLNYLSKTTFKDIPKGNLRKYVTRLVEEGILNQTSKGSFVIGKPKTPIVKLITHHYLFSFGMVPCGIPCGEYLLYEEKIIDAEPQVKLILSNQTFSNRNVDNIKIFYCDNSFVAESGTLMKVLELLNSEVLINEEDKPLWILKINEYLTSYNDSLMENHNIFYPRKVYLRLANFLNLMHISNRVMEIYEIKKKI